MTTNKAEVVRLVTIFGKSLLGIKLRSGVDLPRGELFKVLLLDQKVRDAMRVMFTNVDGACPTCENVYTKDPQLGDFLYIMRNFAGASPMQRGSINAFFDTIFNNIAFKRMESAARIERIIRARYGLSGGEPLTHQKPQQ